ncbi:MAG: hypothetical protein ACI8Q1_000854 [Parvicella sp.]
MKIGLFFSCKQLSNTSIQFHTFGTYLWVDVINFSCLFGNWRTNGIELIYDMKLLITIIIASSFLTTMAQIDSVAVQKNLNDLKVDFLYLYSGQLIESSGLELKVDINWRGNSPYYFLSDSLNFPVHIVKFYQKNGVFLANVSRYEYCENNNCFANKMVAGKVNLFYYQRPANSTKSTPNPKTMGGLVIFTAASSIKPSVYENYYNLGTGDLKKMNFRNLMLDLNDNQESMNTLHIAKRSQNIGGPFLAVGIIACTASFIWWMRETSQNSQIGSNTFQYSLLTGGLVTVTIGGLYFNKEKRMTRKAAIIYNQ